MQYQQVTGAAVPAGTKFLSMEAQELDPGFSNEQRLLMELRDKLCGGNAAELARHIHKDATYVHRLLYPAGKPGRKGVGLEIMEACNRAFFLPFSFWQLQPPALDEQAVFLIKERMGERYRTIHGVREIEPQRVVPAMGGRGARGATWSVLVDHSPSPEDYLTVIDGRVRAPASIEHIAREPRPNFPTMQPILSWMHEDDLPDGEFVMVPRLRINLSAGPGKDQVAFEFNEAQPQAFRAEWIRQQHLKPKKLAAMTASGDSMEPTIHDGDSLLVDTGQVEVKDGKVYALWYEGGERVKRLWRLPGGGLRIRSDNERDHPEIVLGPEYVGHVRIIGRVVHRSGQGGL